MSYLLPIRLSVEGVATGPGVATAHEVWLDVERTGTAHATWFAWADAHHRLMLAVYWSDIHGIRDLQEPDWMGQLVVDGPEQTADNPGLIVHQGRIYVTWRGTDSPTHHTNIAWAPLVQGAAPVFDPAHKIVMTNAHGAAGGASFGREHPYNDSGPLYLAWTLGGTGGTAGQLAAAVTLDGDTWSGVTALSVHATVGGAGLSSFPWGAGPGDTWCPVVWTDPGTHHLWRGQLRVQGGKPHLSAAAEVWNSTHPHRTSDSAPGAAGLRGVVWTGRDQTLNTGIEGSPDRWTDVNDWVSDHRPSYCDLYIVWRGRDNHRINLWKVDDWVGHPAGSEPWGPFRSR